MKKVALVILAGGIGGAESVVKQILTQHKEENTKLYLLTTEENYNYYKECDEVEVVSVGSFKLSLFKKIFRRFINVAFSFIIKRKDIAFSIEMRPFKKRIQHVLEEKSIDVVHAHLLHGIYCLSKIKIPVKKIYTIHDAHGLDNMGFQQSDFVDICKMYNSADYVTSACEYFFNLFKSNGIILNSPQLIPNGIDLSKLQPIKSLDIKNNERFTIVYLGGDRLVKGCDYLEKAIKICVENFQDTQILVYVLRDVNKESAFYKNIIEDNLQPYFKIVGYVKDNAHLEYINIADLYILPSRTEGIANTLLEAIGLQKPIIATNVGGTPEIIKDGVNGFLVEPDASEIAKKIDYLIRHPEIRAAMSFANKELSLTFDWKVIARKYFELYKKA